MRDDRRICKVTVLFGRDDFERLDRYCNQFAFKKSTLISRLVREYLSKENYEPARSQVTRTRSKQGGR
jgi:hypothetical protein